MIGRNDACWCGSGKKWKKCHYPTLPALPPSLLAKEYYKKYDIRLKTDEEIVKIRAACRLAAYILQKTCEQAKAGVTTKELNDFAHALHLEAGAIPASLGYGTPPFPGSICTSVNDVICHGIPDNTPLQDGDIINLDIACILDGYYGDNSAMVCIGTVSKERQLVTDVAKACLDKSIEILKPGLPLSAIGDCIQTYAHAKGCSVVYQFVGHGVGVDFHEAPQVFHYANDCHIPLVPGMTFTIEPMINAGVAEGVVDPVNKWTVRTKDARPSAQWEHTVLITPTGHEILTLQG